MLYSTSIMAIAVFAFFVLGVLALSFYLGRRGQTAKGYYAAHGQIHWSVNGMAFAGDYLSAASFLGICGLIASYGYDGFLYSIGYLAGWIVALLVIAEPIKRLGKFTFTDALDSHYDSRGIKLAAAISTLVVSAFYLIPQMVGAGALITPLLGLPHYAGVLLVGVTVTLIVVTAGMVSTTWVQFIKGTLLVIFCAALTIMILMRGFTAKGSPTVVNPEELRAKPGVRIVENAWKDKPYAKVINAEGVESVYKITDAGWVETQTVVAKSDGTKLVNGKPQTKDNDLRPIGTLAELPGGAEKTGSLGPFDFFDTLRQSKVVTWSKEVLKDESGASTTVFTPAVQRGEDLLKPGGYFKGMKSPNFTDKLDFISLMIALFCGTASLPHILIRYYTVKDQSSARKSTVVGIAAIGFFYVLTLYLGLGAMTSGAMDVTDNNMAAPLLARSFSELMFAVISAIAFTTVLGTVSGLIMAGAGAVAHDLLENLFRIPMTDHQKVLFGKGAAALLGGGAMVLGILFKDFNVSFLVGWAFNIAASANLPALVMMLFWRRTTKQGIACAVAVGMLSSLAWILLSADTYSKVYGWDPKTSIVPFSQPGLVTIPLGFLVLIVVSLLTPKPAHSVAEELAET
ncbi:MAG: cation acetate symporter [Candidatus Hydrogenedentes bacterium]|nr:cation acetate symporter [Candidatus Hydrogenedentota bacterium]